MIRLQLAKRSKPSRAVAGTRSIDLRRMIGVLERSDFEVLGGSVPGLAQLGKLAERARASGLAVEVCLEGQPRPLPPALDLVSFRIVQEALTNAIKHAGPAEARVRVTFTDDDLVLEISDTGRSPSRWRQSPNAGGLGLVGMQERLSLYGGDLETGPRRGGGFEVRARLPLLKSAGTVEARRTGQQHQRWLDAVLAMLLLILCEIEILADLHADMADTTIGP